MKDNIELIPAYQNGALEMLLENEDCPNENCWDKRFY